MDYIKELEDCIQMNNLTVDFDKIKLALYFAEESHVGQQRKSGEDYITHPVEVAKILIDMKMDTDTIVAGILHDIVEDTLITVADLRYNFGDQVADLVDGVTKLGILPDGTKDQSENVRKMILAMTQNIKVIIIKLADRIHNMRTLKFMKKEKQLRIARETLDIYAPLAHRLGIAKIKWELEDLSLHYLEPEKYEIIKNLIDKKKDERKDYIDLFIQTIVRELRDVGIKSEVKGRFKHFYSIYKKMYEKGKEFDDIYDLMGIRIIVENNTECYHVLGIIHSKYTPVPGRFKDYIAVPKSNNYQSIHTTIVGPLGKFIEIQIRTKEMDLIAEEGIAAHWAYKEKRKVNKDDQIYGWLKNIIEFQKDTDTTEDFVKGVTGDLLNETVFVVSPKGDIKELPLGATVLDFAFVVHTQVGCSCVGAKVDGKIVPLDYKVSNGERVEIITSKNSKGPSKDWLDIVVTQGAKSKIKKFLKDSNLEETIKLGKDSLEKEISRFSMTLKEFENNPLVKKHMEKNNINNVEELYYQIGEKRSKLDIIVNKIKRRIEEERKVSEFSVEDVIKKSESKIKAGKDDQGIIIDGVNNTLIKFARCCTPLPGDKIRGYITRLSGITVHRAECPNYIKMLENDPSREIIVSWDESMIGSKVNKYNFSFTVYAYNRPNLLMDIITVISNQKINVSALNTNHIHDDITKLSQIKFSIEISSKEEYNHLIANILKVKDVVSVDR